MIGIVTEEEKEFILEYCNKTECVNCFFYGCKCCYDKLHYMEELKPGYYMLAMNIVKKGAE